MSAAESFARYRPIVDAWDAFLDAVSRPLPACVWTNTLRETPETLAAILEAEGVTAEPLSWRADTFRVAEDVRPGKLWPVVAGLYNIQEEVSLLPVVLLDPRPGERVLDLCASPGNKTARISVAMRNRGTVVANDLRLGRLSALRNTIERLGLINVSTTHYDGASYPRRAGLFDRVLVDAPCSCEGTSRKNPGIVEELAGGGYRDKVRIQTALLERAVRLARPGGRVVYSTCTYAPEENEAVVDEVLRRIGNAVVRMVPARVDGFVASPGLTRWDGRTFDASLRRSIRVWPHQNDTGGFFVAVLEKLPRPGGAVGREAPPAPLGGRAPRDEEELENAIDFVTRRFGIPRQVIEGQHLFRGKTAGFYVVSADHEPPESPRPDACGILFLKTGMKQPKLTTAGAMMVGREATANVVELDRERLGFYFRRRTFPVRAGALRNPTGRGYVIVRYLGRPLGLGFYRPDGPSGGPVESLFPKGWAWGF